MRYAYFIACVFLCFCGISLADDAPPVLYLSAPAQYPGQPSCPLLVRELARQAFLIAARDGMGLYTRDAAMREWEPDSAGNPPADAQGKPALLINMRVGKDSEQTTLNLIAMSPERPEVFSSAVNTPHELKYFMSVPSALANIEPLSRGDFVDQLKKLGYTADVKPPGDLDVAPEVDHLLYQTTLLSPFTVVQQMHAAIRKTGESPARLSALVRGYANLGELTRFQWCSIQKVMTARSLLYAQRMVNEAPDSPFSYYNRAYAYAMTGLHAAALA